MVRPKIALLSLAGTSMGVVSPQMIRSAATPSRWRRVILATALAAAALGLAASSEAAEEHKRRPAAAPAVQRGPAAVNRPGRLVRPLPNQRPGLIAPNIGGRGNVAQPLPNQRPGLIAPHIGGRGNVAPPLPNGPVHPPGGVPPSGETRFVQREMVVHIGADVSQQTIQSVAARHGLTTVGSQDLNLVGRTLYRFRVTGNRPVADVIRALEAENIAATAQPNYMFRLQQDLNSAHAG